jgi:hypothetical protein
LPANFNLLSSIITPPKGGRLSLIGSGKNSYLIYQSDGVGKLTQQVDSFTYGLTLFNPVSQQNEVYRATDYIYVLKDTHHATVCRGKAYTFALDAKPVGTTFQWTKSDGSSPFTGTGVSLSNVTDTVGYWVKPVVPNAATLYGGDFPAGKLTLWVADQPGTDGMLWTGLFNNDWQHPQNWVQRHGTGNSAYEAPVHWAPTGCVNVEIPGDAPNFPELNDADAPSCERIQMDDRALLKNPHALTYDSARVEFKLKPSERDRYLMWSAPLRNMVAGDYHFNEPATDKPEWGDFQIDLFQLSNEANTFAISQGAVGTGLPLGQAFNLKMTTTSQNTDSVLWFPKPNTQYIGVDNDQISFTGTTKRVDAARFITDAMQPTGNGMFREPVKGDFNGATLLQVVNPYFAYLNFAAFYQANKDSIANGYYVWDGKPDDGFVGVLAGPNGRYLITAPTSSLLSNPGDIPPLQSFIVAKNTAIGAQTVNGLSLSPDMTSTTPSASYTLRAANVLTGGLLQIQLTEGSASASAALVYDLAASPGSDSNDLPALTSEAMPLALSTLNSEKKPLLMNSSNDFAASTIPLSLNVKNAGQVMLTFSGLKNFGYTVYLDDSQTGKEMKLTPSDNIYSFTKGSSDAALINGRFSLRMVYTGTGITTGTEGADNSSLHAADDNGSLQISGLHPGTMLYIYNIKGQLLYQQKMDNVQFSMLNSQLGKGIYLLSNDGRSVKVSL